MKVTKEGIYKDKTGEEFPVFNVCKKGKAHFRSYYLGAYYDVNEEKDKKDNAPGGIHEMVEFVRDLD